MADFYYNVAISNTVPERPISGWFWVQPSTGQVYMYILDGWKPVTGGDPVTVYVETTKWMKAAVQSTAPTGSDVELGKIWLNTSTGQAYIYVDTWRPFTLGG